MGAGRGIWNDDRELTNLGLIWVIAWNLIGWLLLVPRFMSEPAVPAFYTYGMVMGSLIWAAISVGGDAPAVVFFLRARQLRIPRIPRPALGS